MYWYWYHRYTDIDIDTTDTDIDIDTTDTYTYTEWYWYWYYWYLYINIDTTSPHCLHPCERVGGRLEGPHKNTVSLKGMFHYATYIICSSVVWFEVIICM